MRKELLEQGFCIRKNILSYEQIRELAYLIESSEVINSSFRRSAGLLT